MSPTGIDLKPSTVVAVVDAGYGTIVYHLREGTHEKFAVVRCALKSELDLKPTCKITQVKALDNFAIDSAV